VNRNFSLLLSGQLVSQIGDKFHMLAVAFLVLQTTGSPAKMGLVLFCSVFPNMLLGIIAGAIVDRYNRKTIIVCADLIRGLIVLTLGVLYYLGALTFPILLLAQVLLSVCTAFFDPAIPAIIPQIVKQEHLARANSRAQFVSGIAMIVGPTLGGLAVAWVGYLPVFVINACSYLFSAVFESIIRLPALERASSGRIKMVDDIVDGCRYVYRRKSLVVILVMVGLIHFFVGSIEVVIPVLATDLKGEGAQNIGYIQTFFGLGMVITAFILGIRSIAGKEVRFLFGGVFLIGLLLLTMGGFHMSGIRIILPFLILFLAIGGAVIFAGTSFRTILQKDVDEMMMGRVFGFVSSVGNISIPLATLIFGILMEYVPHNLILAINGFILLPTSILAYYKYAGTLSERQRQKSMDLLS
jgi:MFS family permease